MSDKVFASSLSLDDCRDALDGGLDYEELDSVARALLVHCDAARRGVVTETQRGADLDLATGEQMTEPTKPPASAQRCRQCLGECAYYDGPVIVECFRCGGSGQEPAASPEHPDGTAPPEQPARGDGLDAVLKDHLRSKNYRVVERFMGAPDCEILADYFAKFVAEHAGKRIVRVTFEVDDAPGKDGAR